MYPTTDADGERLLAALSRAVTSGPGVAGRPGQLRSRLDRALGAEQAGRLRGRVHQLVVAAEEHLPARLSAVAPLTPESIARLAADLATARGWSPDAARATTELWCRALGLAGPPATSTPQPGSVPPPVPRFASP